MKKILYTAGVLALLSVTLFTSCKKDSEAFPTKSQSNGVYNSNFAYITPYFPNIADADGILISAQVYDEKTVIVSPYLNTYEYGMAKFTGTKGNFSVLTNIGGIKLNDSNLVSANDLSYSSSITTTSLGLATKVKWQITGSTIPSFVYTLNGVNPAYSNGITNWDSKWVPIYPRTLYTVPPRPSNPLTAQDSVTYYPVLTYTAALNVHKSDSTTRYKDSVYNVTVQYTIPFSNFVTNADTVIIAMQDATGFSYIRKASASDAGADFRPNDFTYSPSYNVTSFNLQVNVIKYQDTTVGSKNLYFLKMGSYIKYYNATK
ncbi:MAG: hypothetical protein ABI448_09175 [Bacteroidia bacterium]